MKVTWTDVQRQEPVEKEAEKVLVAVGRAPRTETSASTRRSIKLDRGFIMTNEWMETAEPGVYAIGDIVAGMPQLAHVGAMAGMVVAAKHRGQVRSRRQPRPHSRLHLHRAADRQRRPHRGQAKEKGYTGQGRQVSVRRKLQGHHR